MYKFGDLLRGHTDMLILSILDKEDSYGYMINKKIEGLIKGEFSLSEATLYTSFKRLVKVGYLTSYWQNSESGKKRKHYSITLTGIIALNKQREEWELLTEVINEII
ncbi:MAG: PadR family transcriptional regulator [Tenericutes bacterium]|nr:PadR family transcriptional regulator [Mycoplasmatota bacterium]